MEFKKDMINSKSFKDTHSDHICLKPADLRQMANKQKVNILLAQYQVLTTTFKICSAAKANKSLQCLFWQKSV